MSDNFQVYKGIRKKEGIQYPVLVPNMNGMQRALEANAKEIAVFIAASEQFSKVNINKSISESISRYEPVIKLGIEKGLKIRGYISCVCGCPYEGNVSEQKVANLAQILYKLGCSEISFGDTIGVGTPGSVWKLLKAVLEKIPIEAIAVHFHNTYGQALANILASLEMGITTVDSSCGGIGGCPDAAGATGNVATEDVVYMLDGMGIKTGVELKRLILTGQYICNYLKKENQSRVGIALSNKTSQFVAPDIEEEQSLGPTKKLTVCV